MVAGDPARGERADHGHPSEGRAPTELLQAPWDARTRVHEYGGRSYLPIRTGDGWSVVFSNYDDQRLHRLDEGDPKPYPLTPVPAVPAGLRYADYGLSPDGTEIWCVCEGHIAAPQAEPAEGEEGERPPVEEPGTAGIRRAIVAVPLDGRAAEDAGAIRELVTGAQFYASPAASPAAGTWRGCSGTTRACRGTAPRCASQRSRTAARSRPGPSRAASRSRPSRRCGATTSPCT